jgi:membrane-bound metal-dependent hydrolase YbcI (DUF457 family)
MDIITHFLAGCLVKKIKPEPTSSSSVTIALFVGTLIPDIGEIRIQAALATKFGAALAVYDDRTSDLEIAQQLSVTWVYDILHSFVLPLLLCLCVRLLSTSVHLRNIIYFLSIGLTTHILLDSFTHGKVWALKLFYPLSNDRFKILENVVGNWWDWSPKITMPILNLALPVYCICIWFLVAITLFLHNLNHNK